MGSGHCGQSGPRRTPGPPICWSHALPGADAAEARQITERLREKISRIVTPVADGAGSQVTISVGVATLGSSRRDLDELLASADHALYQAKEAGRNRVCVLAASPG